MHRTLPQNRAATSGPALAIQQQGALTAGRSRTWLHAVVEMRGTGFEPADPYGIAS